MFYWALCASLGPPRWLCCWRISSPLCASLGTEQVPHCTATGATQPIIVLLFLAANIKRTQTPTPGVPLGHAVAPCTRGVRGLAHRALVRRHFCRPRRGWAASHASRGTLTRLPLAFLSGFVHLFIAEHVRRRWFLGVLVYLPAHFVDRVPLLAARVRSGVRHRCRSTQRLLVGHKVVFQYARSFAASCGFVQCSLEKRCS